MSKHDTSGQKATRCRGEEAWGLDLTSHGQPVATLLLTILAGTLLCSYKERTLHIFRHEEKPHHMML